MAPFTNLFDTIWSCVVAIKPLWLYLWPPKSDRAITFNPCNCDDTILLVLVASGVACGCCCCYPTMPRGLNCLRHQCIIPQVTERRRRSGREIYKSQSPPVRRTRASNAFSTVLVSVKDKEKYRMKTSQSAERSHWSQSDGKGALLMLLHRTMRRRRWYDHAGGRGTLGCTHIQKCLWS